MRIRDLEVYKRAFKAAIEIHECAKDWPKYEVYGGLSDQIRRCTRGICANVVEGLAKNEPLEQRRFLNIAVGSAQETQVWLEFALAHQYISQAQFDTWQSEYDEIVKMLVGLMKRREEKGEG